TLRSPPTAGGAPPEASHQAHQDLPSGGGSAATVSGRCTEAAKRARRAEERRRESAATVSGRCTEGLRRRGSTRERGQRAGERANGASDGAAAERRPPELVGESGATTESQARRCRGAPRGRSVRRGLHPPRCLG